MRNPVVRLPTREAEVSIAVLPFSDVSAAKDQEDLCEGMAEEIKNGLVLGRLFPVDPA